jgi:hypothetical protein
MSETQFSILAVLALLMAGIGISFSPNSEFGSVTYIDTFIFILVYVTFLAPSQEIVSISTRPASFLFPPQNGEQIKLFTKNYWLELR